MSTHLRAAPTTEAGIRTGRQRRPATTSTPAPSASRARRRPPRRRPVDAMQASSFSVVLSGGWTLVGDASDARVRAHLVRAAPASLAS
jgi:hypothetical protein